MKYIQVKEGQYLDKNGFITCPMCGRKKSVIRNDGELRGKIHCKCKTGNHHTVFKLDGDVYLCYQNKNKCLVIF